MQRNGGIITSGLAGSDYVILEPASKQFTFMAQEGLQMFSPDWPAQCEKAGAIVDSEEFRLLPPSKRPVKKAKRGR
jgi:hypothetical protein